MKKNNPPVFTARSGSICANVWEKWFRDGMEYRVTVNSCYKTEDKQWQRGRTFFTDELPRIAEVIARAQQWIGKQRRQAELSIME